MAHKNSVNTLGIDFGTSNSAAGIMVNGQPHLIEIEPGEKTLPTSVFFDFAARKTVFGNAANRALIQGHDGRFMRALKSVLGTSLMHEKRMILGERLDFIDIVARFLAQVKSQAEAACWQEFSHAVSGRPVHFHSGNPAKDQQALKDLTECYRRAGFKDVQFLFEPEAAAMASGGLNAPGALGLIVDIGGGTSDFSLFRSMPGAPGASHSNIEILASHGVRIGGTDFDKSLSVDHVMPLFGKGGQIKNEMGSGTHTAPNAMYQNLASWEKIPFLYNGQTRRDVAHLQRLAVDPAPMARLSTVLELELGHDIAFAVERGKIRANAGENDEAKIDLRSVEKGLAVDLSAKDLTSSLTGHAENIRDSAVETLALANCPAARVDKVIFVGGTSLMTIVEHTLAPLFPNAQMAYSNAFTAIVDGLAIASADPRWAA